MKTRLVLIAVLVVGAITLHAAEAKIGPSVDAAAAFARLKALAGDWEATTAEGKSRLSYEIVSGGTALLERESSEKMPAMLTLFHLDGERLLLTHYCVAGNQPRMQARAFNPETGELEFRLLDATNLASPNAGHMHNVKIRLVDADHLITEWQFYENGQSKFTESTQFTRVR